MLQYISVHRLQSWFTIKVNAISHGFATLITLTTPTTCAQFKAVALVMSLTWVDFPWEEAGNHRKQLHEKDPHFCTPA